MDFYGKVESSEDIMGFRTMKLISESDFLI